MCSAESHAHSRTITRMMEGRMPLSSTRFWTIPAIIGLPVLACLLAVDMGAPHSLTPAFVGLAGACAAWIATRQPAPAPARQEDASPSPAATLGENDPKLRHDIRGIISPVMLVADQLALSTDPATKKAAETINDSLDRLTARLKQRKTD
ncbi:MULTISPECIES: hypothetical protein [Acetobacter]|jgi:hypothetical protein|uniref:Uncharacterized protein n=1 Tax=Acetobacter lovaniensis TaxID=104100 RepID=A0A841QD16_9PROT|nr:hypothetical protein [Acetobacter lovaniensis]MBB6456017.1 hypothetical protein [Acetobacter lovaniensis]MCI1697053.1 hypothetical protein [Acetobacter lovaniensis]MCI1796115.1 hypothetical protein [Acetobacter lovaniensis]MCP1238153.1 hypothetical protein [Acetobacter lovaniensis]GBQ67187.1 hypothetical protein AA0474_1326 [Acetobacter lovaniensis NRIC 0474]